MKRRPIWESTLFRYLLGPSLAIGLMVVLVIRFAGIDPKYWREDDVIFQTAPEGPEWQTFSRARLNFYLDQGEPVLVHFVADWNPLSMKNRVALCANRRLLNLMRQQHVALLLADASATTGDTGQTLGELDEEDRPLLVLFEPGKEPIVFRGPLDENALAGAIASLGTTKGAK